MVDEPGLCVLLVEDESIVAMDIERQLLNLGYQVIGPVDNGPEAVETAQEQRPDLVLMDVKLIGEMDGIDAARRIRSERDVPLIFISAFSDQQSVRRAKQSTPFGYILKPFQERELAIAIDLAVYKHTAEQEIAASRDLLRCTLSAISEAVVTTDGDERIRFFNPAARRLLGLGDEDLGRTFRSRLSMTRLSDAADARNRYDLFTPDGRSIPVDVSVSEASADGSRVRVFRDARVQQAAEERLVQAKRHAEEAATLKGKLVSRITHDLRTPLNSIVGMTGLALDMALDPEQREYLSVAKASADALDALIRDALRHSQNADQDFDWGAYESPFETAGVHDLSVESNGCTDPHRRALLVEDNRVNRLLARRVLEDLGYVVLEADTGDRALEILSNEGVDLVLMDIEMPGMNGYETTKEIRSGSYGRSDIPIFAVSGHDPRQEAERMTAAGIDAQLPKPFRAEDLAVLVARFDRPEESFEQTVASFTRQAREALRRSQFQELAEISKVGRRQLAERNMTRAAEVAFRVQIASRKQDAVQVAKLLGELDSVAGVSGKKRENQYNITQERE